jgi:hypothetical protein
MEGLFALATEIRVLRPRQSYLSSSARWKGQRDVKGKGSAEGIA